MNLYSQDWDKRHKFAKTYFGISNYFSTNLTSGSFIDTNQNTEPFERNGFVSPAINIGATHFWGYADLYVSINTTNINFNEGLIKNDFRLGTFTGLRVYPSASKENTIRPYIGYKFSPFRYKQKNIQGQEFKFTQVKSVLDVGLGIQLPNFYVTIEYGKVVNPEFNSFLSRTVTNPDRFPSNIFQLGLNYTIETTKKASKQPNKLANALFSKSNNWGLFFALGPSSSFPVVSSDHIVKAYPFLDDKSFPIIFPDASIGYHFLKLDLITAFSFRPINQKRKAYAFEQTIKRRSMNLEAYKFLFDFHGFVPYLGIGLGFEKIKLTEIDNSVIVVSKLENKLSPSLVFGWDIRPSVKGDWWILRTNLRYFPFLYLENSAGNLSLQHLEFNFIQFVLYPQKLKKLKSIASAL